MPIRSTSQPEHIISRNKSATSPSKVHVQSQSADFYGNTARGLLAGGDTLPSIRGRISTLLELSQTKSVLRTELLEKRRNKPGRVFLETAIEAVPEVPCSFFCADALGKVLPPDHCPVIQRLCGNRADLASDLQRPREATHLGMDREPSDSRMMTLENAGWQLAAEDDGPEKTNQSTDYFYLALECLGLTHMINRITGVKSFMLKVHKEDLVIGLERCRDWIKKLLSFRNSVVVNLIDACEDIDYLYLIYEECQGAGCLNYRTAQHNFFDQIEVARMMQQVAAAIASCRDVRLPILDWSMWNIMGVTLGSVNRVKVFGAGLAGIFYARDILDNDAVASQVRRSFLYRSPELHMVWDSPSPFEKLDRTLYEPTDIWSLCAICFECLTGVPRIDGFTEEEVRKALRSKTKLRSLQFFACDVLIEGVRVIDSGMQFNAKHRPAAEEFITNPWVSGQTLSGKGGVVDKLVDCLYFFARQPGVVRAIGELLRRAARPEKIDFAHDLFSIIDVCGVGTIQKENLLAIAANRKEDIDETFKLMDDDDIPGITQDEFTRAAMLIPGILTERMMTEVFETMDRDGSGQLSIAELYLELSLLNPINFQELEEFVVAGDKNCDQVLDFKELCGLLPSMEHESDRRRRRQKRLLEIYDLCVDVNERLHTACKKWAVQLRKRRKAFLSLQGRQRVRDQTEAHNLSRLTVRTVYDLEDTIKFIPRLQLPGYAKEILGNSYKTEPDVDPAVAAGVFALDLCLRLREPTWHSALDLIIGQGKSLSTIRIETAVDFLVLDQAVDEAATASVKLVNDILAWLDSCAYEQSSILDAAGYFERQLPKVNISPRSPLKVISHVSIEEAERKMAAFASRQQQTSVTLRERTLGGNSLHDQSLTVGTVMGSLSRALMSRFGFE